MKLFSVMTFCLILGHFSFGNTTDTLITKDSVMIIDYYKNGNRKLEGFYKIAVSDKGDTSYLSTGKQTKYFNSGKIQGYQYFKDGIPHGKFECYTDKGCNDKIFFFIDGKLNRPYKFYYPDGQIMREGIYRNDADFGLCKHYYKDGKLSMEEYYN